PALVEGRPAAEPGADRGEAALRADLALRPGAPARTALRERRRPRPLPAASARGPGRRARRRPHAPGRAPSLPIPVQADVAAALDDRGHRYDRIRDGPPSGPRRDDDAVADRDLPLM